jgi:hypothetical protein
MTLLLGILDPLLTHLAFRYIGVRYYNGVLLYCKNAGPCTKTIPLGSQDRLPYEVQLGWSQTVSPLTSSSAHPMILDIRPARHKSLFGQSIKPDKSERSRKSLAEYTRSTNWMQEHPSGGGFPTLPSQKSFMVVSPDCYVMQDVGDFHPEIRLSSQTAICLPGTAHSIGSMNDGGIYLKQYSVSQRREN